MLDLKKMLKPGRARAADDSTPNSLKMRLSDAQLEKLRRRAEERGVSIASIIRELIEVMP